MGIQEDIESLFQERYPHECLTEAIRNEINSIVRKIAFENMELEVGLRLIDEWMDGIKGKEQMKEK